MTFGKMPRAEHLTTLTRGVSTTDDVLRALGEPRGRGIARHVPQEPARDIWFYEYTESKGTGEVNIAILLVYFAEKHYDGHLWFSSMPRSQRD